MSSGIHRELWKFVKAIQIFLIKREGEGLMFKKMIILNKGMQRFEETDNLQLMFLQSNFHRAHVQKFYKTRLL